MANTALSKVCPVLVASATPSGASTVEFTGLSSDYNVYEFIFLNIDPSADGELWLRTSTDGGSSYDSGAGNYRWNAYYLEDDTSQAAISSTSDTQINLFDAGGGTSANENVSGHLWIHDPSVAEYTNITSHFLGTATNSALRHRWGGGQRLSAADVDAVQFLPSTGTISGEIRLYGYRNT